MNAAHNYTSDPHVSFSKTYKRINKENAVIVLSQRIIKHFKKKTKKNNKVLLYIGGEEFTY